MELAIIILLVASMSWVYKKLFVSCPPDGGPKKITIGGWMVILAATTLLIGSMEESKKQSEQPPPSRQIAQEILRVEQQLSRLDKLMVQYDHEKSSLVGHLSDAREKGMSLEEAQQSPFLEETARRLSNLQSWSESVEQRRQELRTQWRELDRHRFQSRHIEEIAAAMGRSNPATVMERYSSIESLGSLESDRIRQRISPPPTQP
ncbi:MAG: hypothetical protein QF752_11750 [Planctomycetota bacterium]|jgi:predicted  nucleic acid-binding Zn-ribbon protein|nr:hypothetical protein [Planctomycetota bacterium]